MDDIVIKAISTVYKVLRSESAREHPQRPPEYEPALSEAGRMQPAKLRPSSHTVIPSQPPLASTAETIEELKRRLGKELYRVELDLQGGLRIAGRPCDCASKKHNLGIESTAEELMSYDKNPIYGEVIKWYNAHVPEFEPAEIVKHPPAYYQQLTPEVRRFRKEVMGTEKLGVLLSEADKENFREKLGLEKEK